MQWKVRKGTVGIGHVVNGVTLVPIICSCDKTFDESERVADYINVINDLLVKPNLAPTGVKAIIANGIPVGKAFIAFQRGGYVAYYNAVDLSII